MAAELKLQPLWFALDQVSHLSGGLAAFRDSFWKPFYDRLKELRAAQPITPDATPLRIERNLAADIARERGSSRFVIVTVVLDDTDLRKVELPSVFYQTDAFYMRDQGLERLIEFLLEIVRELEGGVQRPLPR